MKLTVCILFFVSFLPVSWAEDVSHHDFSPEADDSVRNLEKSSDEGIGGQFVDFTMGIRLFSEYINSAGINFSKFQKDPDNQWKRAVWQYDLNAYFPIDLKIGDAFTLDGMNLNLWFSQPTYEVDWGTDYDARYEFDPSGSFTGKIFSLNYNIGTALFDIANPEVFRDMLKADVLHTWMELNYPLDLLHNLTISPYTAFSVYTPTDDAKPLLQGVHSFNGLRTSYSPLENVTLLLANDLCIDDGANAFESAYLFRTFATVAWDVGGQWTWEVVNYKYFLPLDNVSDRREEHVFGSGVLFKF